MTCYPPVPVVPFPPVPPVSELPTNENPAGAFAFALPADFFAGFFAGFTGFFAGFFAGFFTTFFTGFFATFLAAFFAGFLTAFFAFLVAGIFGSPSNTLELSDTARMNSGIIQTVCHYAINDHYSPFRFQTDRLFILTIFFAAVFRADSNPLMV